MDPTRPVNIAIDAIGGDHAPEAVLDGVGVGLQADPALSVSLVGPDDIVTPFAAAHDRVTAVTASEVIAMGEHPATAVRTKRDSSMVVGASLVRDGKADAFFSAGNTGATMAAALLVMGRMHGIQRPAIAGVMPSADAPVVVLDIGANAECRPEHLVQFAHMGSAYSHAVLGVAQPKVALLNIGSEPTKGSGLALDAHELMQEAVPGFAGNIEANDIPVGKVDVVVTDGFTGNVVLKLMEGLSETLLDEVREAMTAGPLDRLAAAVLSPSLRRLKDRLDPDMYGAAPLLGVDGLCLIGHGSSNAMAIASALRYGAKAVREDLLGSIERVVSPQASGTA